MKRSTSRGICEAVCVQRSRYEAIIGGPGPESRDRDHWSKSQAATRAIIMATPRAISVGCGAAIGSRFGVAYVHNDRAKSRDVDYMELKGLGLIM